MTDRSSVAEEAGFLSIGALSKASGVSVRALRHYDGLGLLQSFRADNGYRRFRRVAVVQVQQIQRFLTAGFTLEEVRSFPGCMLMIEGAALCTETKQAQRERLAAIEDQMAALERQRVALMEMLQRGTQGLP
ncbi:MerR family transcriptional regulator [Roseateles depolymerans]|uniref:MerR family transcriptional regulator n=1 Tax=Roseateles depolymerans TaxID=76731 RepID=UPI00073D769D|nr:MerR family transcriptional regulator [Roseateles depolymerans]REG22280.1 MerR family transcriptional regulator [Roseateles depolymerans]